MNENTGNKLTSLNAKMEPDTKRSEEKGGGEQ